MSCFDTVNELAWIMRKALHDPEINEPLIVSDELHDFVSEDRVLQALYRASKAVLMLHEKTEDRALKAKIENEYNRLLEEFMNKCMTKENARIIASLILVPDEHYVDSLSDKTEVEITREENGVHVCAKWFPLYPKAFNYVAMCRSVIQVYDHSGNPKWILREYVARENWGGSGVKIEEEKEISEDEAMRYLKNPDLLVPRDEEE